MNDRNSDSRQPRLWAPFLSFVLVLVYPLLSFLWRRDYPFLTFEVVVLLSLVLAGSALLALTVVKLRGAIGAILTAAVIAAVFTLQFDLGPSASAVCLAASLGLAFWLRERFYLYALPVFAALLLGAWLDSFGDDGRIHPQNGPMAVDGQLPPVVHILLDSFIGLDGLPPYPASELIRAEVMEFFEDYGFRVFPKAYSRYFSTADSMYSALNFYHGGDTGYGRELAMGQPHALKSNAYFDALDHLGYRFSIYQTSHLDFCRSHPKRLDRCWRYEHPNVLTIRAVPDPGERTAMLAKVLLMQSSLFIAVARKGVVDPYVAVHDPRVFENLRNDILDESGGHAFFAHVLLPHGPFAFLHDCSIRYAEDKRVRYAFLSTESGLHPSVYEHRSLRYFEQMDCALHSLRTLFEEMRRDGSFERAIIVLHGDHGSGIARNYPGVGNRSELTPEDYRSSYSTLFAYRFPHSQFGVDDRSLPLASLLEGVSARTREYVMGRQTNRAVSAQIPINPEGSEPFVYLGGVVPLAREDIALFDD